MELLRNEVRLNAAQGRYRGWKGLLQEEEKNDLSKVIGIAIQFEATAKEDIRIGFTAPSLLTNIQSLDTMMGESMETEEMNNLNDSTATPSNGIDEKGDDRGERNNEERKRYNWAYELIIGTTGNTEVVLQKNGKKEKPLVTLFAGRTCLATDYIPYWILLQQTTIVFGIGTDIGQDPILKYTILGDTNMTFHTSSYAFSNWDSPVSIRNIRITSSPTSTNLDALVPRVIVRNDPFGVQDIVTPEQHKAYEEACEVARKRAGRFGGDYKHPDIKTFLDPKFVRKFQRMGHSDPGFATGFDLLSQEEASKREARMNRFQTPEFSVDFSTDTAQALANGLTQDEWTTQKQQKEKLENRAKKFGMEIPSVIDLSPASQKVQSERLDVPDNNSDGARPMEDAIHVYSLDNNFKRVRTGDVMSYFTGYTPSYVEWINDSSCTVVFHDAFTAGRALISLSREIPPPNINDNKDQVMDVDMEIDNPTDLPSQNETLGMATQDESFLRSQWRYGLGMTNKSQSGTNTWRVLLRKAMVSDLPPEKSTKYHERPKPQDSRGGRRHQNGNQIKTQFGSGGKNSRRDYRGNKGSRSHPYHNSKRKSGGNRTNHNMESKQDDRSATQRLHETVLPSR